MKIVAFSSDRDFEKFYDELTANDFEIVGLVTEKPKKQGRDLTIRPNDAHLFAQKKDILVLTPDRLDAHFVEDVKMLGAQIGFVFAYGKIIPQSVIDSFKHGIINVHPSLLPKYRGASPLQQALLDNQPSTGFSIMSINDMMDAGDIIFQQEIKISHDDNFDSLRDKIMNESSRTLPKIILQFVQGKIKSFRQDERLATFTKKISKADGAIDNDDSADSAYNKIRAFSRWPKTYLLVNEKRLIIHDGKLVNDKLEITKIQPEGKKIMNFDEFKNGYHSLLTKFPSFVKID